MASPAAAFVQSSTGMCLHLKTSVNYSLQMAI